MTVHGASFIREVDDSGRVFAETVRMTREWNRCWLEASPEHMTVTHEIRSHQGTPWISIQNAMGDDLLEQISSATGSEAITVYAEDEFIPRFSYLHLMSGRVLRALEYSSEPKAVGRWIRAESEPDPWESLLFSPEAMQAYRAHEPRSEVTALEANPGIVLGAPLPWACDGKVIRDMALRLQLPWDPWNGRFPEARQHEIIEGSTERWRRFHETYNAHNRPWWKFW